MPDLADDLFDGTFDVSVTYTPAGSTRGSFGTPVPDLRAIIYQGADPGRESGKGLTEAIRATEASFARILLKQSEVAAKPGEHSTVTEADGTVWDILAAENTRAGTWRCTCKEEDSINTRRGGRR